MTKAAMIFEISQTIHQFRLCEIEKNRYLQYIKKLKKWELEQEYNYYMDNLQMI